MSVQNIPSQEGLGRGRRPGGSILLPIEGRYGTTASIVTIFRQSELFFTMTEIEREMKQNCLLMAFQEERR